MVTVDVIPKTDGTALIPNNLMNFAPTGIRINVIIKGWLGLMFPPRPLEVEQASLRLTTSGVFSNFDFLDGG